MESQEKVRNVTGSGKLAIVGVSFRFPGPGGEGFWQALCEGRDLVSRVHESRWSKDAYLHPNAAEPGRSYTFAAGSLGDISGFDAAFFGISPREAAHMDPQQRLLLELAWEAMESGGIRPSSLRGSRTGVMIGFSGSDYGYLHSDDLDSVDAFFMTGSSASIAANRVSYFYDLRGPSLAIDTACSSALTAFHLACESVRSGNCDVALSGAVNLHTHPTAFVAFSKASMLSKEGACRAFDAAGDGYVRSEGCAMVVLKRLDAALADGNRIYAVVAGTGVNCDGRTNGLTVPSAAAQSALLKEVYERAGIDPADIDYVEAHGTGTAVGDPIEAQALGQALGRARPAGRPLLIGSVKTNVGHMEPAAGMAGLVKAIYCLQHRAVPRSLHFDTPNPRIPFAELNLAVVQELQPLDPDKRLVIGVNSFGFGGANGHVILESAPVQAPRAAPAPALGAPILVCGHSEAALRAAAQAMAAWLRQREDLALYDIAHAAARYRDWHRHRAIVFAEDRAQAAERLDDFAQRGSAEAVASGRALERPGKPVFVYGGNGAQWAGMGRKLLDEDPVFRAAVECVDALFRRHTEHSILETLHAEDLEQRLQATEVAQPLLFAIQVGITERLRGWGITPAATLGHSVGEIAAAWACGALSLEDATKIVFHRSAWQGRTRGSGSMTAVRIDPEGLRSRLDQIEAGPRLAIAAFNGPRSATVAGAAPDLEALEAMLRERGDSFSRLSLDYAFHSAAMDPIEAGVRASLDGLRPRAEEVPFISAVTGAPAGGATLVADYWWRNIREPVRFAEAFRCLRESGHAVFIEISPRPILGGYMAECLGAELRDCRILPTMAPNGDGLQALRKRAFEVVNAGCATDFGAFFPVAAPYVDVPGYPWQHERHWYEPSPGSHELLQHKRPHTLLGRRLRHDTAEWESRLDLSRLPAYADHRVGGEVLFPAAAFAEMALAACAELRDGTAREIEDLTIHAPLVLDAEHSKTVRLSMDADDGRMLIRSRTTTIADGWRLQASGRLPLQVAAQPATAAYEPRAAGDAIDADAHYAALAAMGLDYGPAFRTVTRAWVEPGGVAATLSPPAAGTAGGEPMQLDPSALDACFQLIVHMQKPDPDGAEPIAFVPVRIGRLSVVRPGQRVDYAVIRETQRGPRSALASCVLYGADRRPVAYARDVRFRALPRRESSQVIAMRGRAIPLPIPGLPRSACLPPIERLRAACMTHLHNASRLAARQRYYAVVEPLLEAMLSAFAQEALAALKSDPSSPAIDPRRFEWIRRVAGNGELPPATQIWTELLADNTDYADEILHLGRIGLHVADLARGEIAVESATPDLGDFSDALAQLVACAAAVPMGGRLRALVLAPEGSDLGARILNVLDRDRADCRVCTDLAALGNASALADLVVLDARVARDSVQALDAARNALADGGLLALLEAIPSRSAALANEIIRADESASDFGSSPREHAIVRQQWQAALASGGFVVESLVEDIPGASAGPFILLARAAPRENVAEVSPAPQGAWLLAAGSDGESLALSAALSAELLQRGHPVALLDRETPWDEALAAARGLHGTIAGIVELSLLGHDRRGRAPRETLDRQVARCVSLGGLFEACGTLALNAPIWVATAGATTGLLPEELRRSPLKPPNPDDAAAWGFVRAAANEYPGLKLRLLDLAAADSAASIANVLADAILYPDAEDEAILTPFGRYVVRVDAQPLARLRAEGATDASEATTLEIAVPGQLKNLGWIRRPLRKPADDEIEIDVRAAGLNFRDVMYAMGQLSEEALETGFAGLTLGMELSGVVRATGAGVKAIAAGDRVMAFAGASFGTRIITRASSVLKMPAAWSFEAGATVPVAFLTAYYALNQLAHLQEGERVLIHGAAGGVGMAAIQIARNAGAEIFATAGSAAKRDVVRLLGADHVLDSRTLDFAGEILARTQGRGVDVVLNSLAGEAMLRSLQIVRPLGRFLELGKRDYYENSRIGLRPFRNNISYFGIDVDQLMLERPAYARRMMSDLLALFEEGVLSPLPYHAFPAADPEGAFRYMQQSRHIGKVVLRMDPAPRATAAAPVAHPALRLSPDATYLVTGGLGGFGLRSARWLAEKGARNLVLIGRGAPSAPAALEIESLGAAGVRVRIERCDVSDYAALLRLLRSIQADMPPLRGILHAAGVIRDGLIRNLDREQIEDVFVPKVLGALNLDRLAQGLPLDFLVFYSSATTTFGNAGQSNYIAANRFMEVLAEARRARGQPALCVGWGPISDAGYLERNAAIREQVAARMGDSAVSSAQALEALEKLLARDLSGAAVLKVSRASLGRLAVASRAARFKDLTALAGEAAPSAVESGEIDRWLAELDDGGLATLLTDLLRTEAATVLRLPADKVDAAQPLQELGFDSLMGVELITAIEARFGVAIPVVAVSEIGTLERLAARLVRELRREHPASASSADALGAQAHRLAAQHAAELSVDEVAATAAGMRPTGARPEARNRAD